MSNIGYCPVLFVQVVLYDVEAAQVTRALDNIKEELLEFEAAGTLRYRHTSPMVTTALLFMVTIAPYCHHCIIVSTPQLY